MNVLLSACSHPREFIDSILNALPQFGYYPNINIGDLIEFIFKWVGSKSDFMFKKGANSADFEDLRSAGLSFLNDITEPSVK